MTFELGAAGGEVLLRPTAPSDLDFVLRAEWDEANRPFLLPWPRERHLDVLGNQDFAHCILDRPADRQAVGYIILAGLRNPHRSVECRRIVVTDKGRGYGRAATRLVKQLAFGRFGAHRLWLDVKATNTRARRLYESEGFVLDGCLRECLLREDGTYDSLIVMSLLKSEHHS